MKGNGRYRVALFTAYLEGDDYNEQVWQTINEGCKELDLELYVFPCRDVVEYESHHVIFSHVLNFFNKEQFDGIILSSSIMLTYLGDNIFDEYFKELSDIPIVGISYSKDYTSSVEIDNSHGIELIVNHLINEHGYKKFGYISGPKTNPEAITRLETMTELSIKHDLTLKKEHILWGDFDLEHLEEVMEPFLRDGLPDIDVLVCANDTMASGAIDIMKKRGIRIPEDIAVTGFDNSAPSVFQQPRLTTINQPIELMTNKALSILKEMMDGKREKQHFTFKPDMIVRKSCGCNIEDELYNNSFDLYMKTRFHTSTRFDFEKLLTSENFSQLESHLAEIFSKYDINNYYLLIYNKFKTDYNLECSIAMREGKLLDSTITEHCLVNKKFIPDQYLPTKERKSILVLPLFTFGHFYGFLLTEATVTYPSFYEDTLINLSTAIMNIKSQNEIKETHKLLMESEKYRFLGNLVAGLAHEINTPVGISITAVSHLSDNFKKTLDTYLNKQLGKNALENFFNDGINSINMIEHNLDTTKNLINRFKQISAASDFELKSAFDIVNHIKKLIDRERQKIDKDITFKLDLPPIIIIDNYAGVISQVLKNLISNSLLHGFSSKDKGEIYIELKDEIDYIILIYSDDGIGCTDDQIEKIFNPFFTTKRSMGHTGLGLTISYNLIRNKLNGDITTYCRDGQLYFRITIPKNVY